MSRPDREDNEPDTVLKIIIAESAEFSVTKPILASNFNEEDLAILRSSILSSEEILSIIFKHRTFDFTTEQNFRLLKTFDTLLKSGQKEGAELPEVLGETSKYVAFYLYFGAICEICKHNQLFNDFIADSPQIGEVLIELIKLIDRGLLHLKPPMILQNLVADIGSLEIEKSAILTSLDLQLRNIQTAELPRDILTTHLRDLNGDDSNFGNFVIKTYPKTRSYRDLISELSFCDGSEFPILDLSPLTLREALSRESINNFVYLDITNPELKLRPISTNIILRKIYKNHCLRNNFLGSSLSYEDSIADFFRKNRFNPTIERNIKIKLISSSYRKEFAAAIEGRVVDSGFSFGFGYNNDNLAKDLAEINVEALSFALYLDISIKAVLDGKKIISPHKRKIEQLSPAFGLNIRYLEDKKAEIYVEDPILAKRNNFKLHCQQSLENYKSLIAPDVVKGAGAAGAITEKRIARERIIEKRAAEMAVEAERIEQLQRKKEREREEYKTKKKREDDQRKTQREERRKKAADDKAIKAAEEAKISEDALIKIKQKKGNERRKKKRDKRMQKALLEPSATTTSEPDEETGAKHPTPTTHEVYSTAGKAPQEASETDLPAPEAAPISESCAAPTLKPTEGSDIVHTTLTLFPPEIRKKQLRQDSEFALLARKAAPFNRYSINVIPRPLAKFLETLKTMEAASTIMLYGGFIYGKNPKDIDLQVVFSDKFIANFLNDNLTGTQGVIGIGAFLESILPAEIRDLVAITHHAPSKTYKMKVGDLIDVTFIGESQYFSSQNWTSTIDAKYYDCRDGLIKFHPSFLKKHPPESWGWLSVAPFRINHEAAQLYFRVVYTLLPTILDLSNTNQIELIQDLTNSACKDFLHKPLELIDAINFFKEHHKMTDYENILFDHSFSSILNLAAARMASFSEEEGKNLSSFALRSCKAFAEYHTPTRLPPPPSASAVVGAAVWLQPPTTAKNLVSSL